jgi:uncharacterized membrane protein
VLTSNIRPDSKPSATIGNGFSSDAAPWLTDDNVPVVMMFLVFAGLASAIPPQADTFFHLRSGLAMWESGWFLTRELFSHTAYGQPLHNHWWLSQLLFYGLFTLGGPVLLTIATGTCGFTALLLSWRLFRGSTEARFVLLFAVFLVVPWTWSLRPQVFSMLLLMVVLRLALSDRLLWILPILVLWANSHALVIFGVAITALVALEALFWSRQSAKRSLLVAIAAAAMPMISPLGWHYWPRVVETVHESRALGIIEYRPAFAFGDESWGIWLLVVGFVAVALPSLRTLATRDRADRILTLATALFAVAAIVSVRNGAFFALVAAPTVSRLLPVAGRKRVRAAPRAAVALIALTAVGVAGVSMYRWRSGGLHNGWQPIGPAAIEAVRNCPGPLYNEFGTGGTLAWLVPEHRVFVDGRVEAYPADFLRRTTAAELTGHYKPLFAEYGIRCAILRTESKPAIALRSDPSMRPAFDDGEWVIFTRAESVSTIAKVGVQ